MAPLIKLGKGVPWVRVVMIARWLYERQKDNLSAHERQELGKLLRKSKGDPRKLSVKERDRLRAIVMKGVTGKKG